MPLLSVVLTTYKDLAYFLEINRGFISAITKLNRVELIIVDDSAEHQDIWLSIDQFLNCDFDNVIYLCTVRNIKQGGARNLAISIANGKYLWFIDSDDRPHIHTAIIAINNQDADCIINNFEYELISSANYYDIEKSSPPRNVNASDIKTNGSHAFDASEIMYLMSTNSISAACWPYFYRRQFLLDQKISFQKNIYFEDLVFNFRCFSTEGIRVIYTGFTIYTHVIRPNSSSTTKNLNRAFMRFRQSLIAAGYCLRSTSKLRLLSSIIVVLYHGVWATK
jgi:glycosyltransferase involved in cell wall biosynthesis